MTQGMQQKGAEPRGIQDRLSLASLYIEMLFNEVTLAKGSGFLWLHGGKAFLISNWHNFSGRKPSSKVPISKTAAIPNFVRCWLWKNRRPDSRGVEGVVSVNFRLPLVNESGKPLF